MADTPRLPKAMPARQAARWLLGGVLRDKIQLSELLAADEITRLAPAERARAQRLATQTLRHLGRADEILSKFVTKLPPQPVLNMLRISAVELCVEGEAAHGVVHDTVQAIKSHSKARGQAGLANAVLRKVSEAGSDEWSRFAPNRLPKWIRARLVHLYDEDTAQAIERAHEDGAPLDVTLRDPSSAETWAEKLGATVLPTGSLRIHRAVQVSELPGFAEGAWWVQDAAAALAAGMLGEVKGKRVLDLCAAPGGKTMQLAAAGAEVTALDQSGLRMKRVQENLTRIGLVARCVTSDALEFEDDLYDAILLDAPCSATGTIRRHPDLPYVKDGKSLSEITGLQAVLLDKAVSLLRPGGRLVYCTCSLLSDEGERQAKEAMERHGLVVSEVSLPGVPDTWAARGGGLRLAPHLWPESGGLDGFFMIAMQKPG